MATGRTRVALLGALALLLAAPFFLFHTVPLHDLPNHIARLHVLFGDAPGADAYYAVHWRLMPNLALEGAVFLLHFLMPIDTAVRVFLAVCTIQLLLGAVALGRAIGGEARGLSIAAVLFVLSGPFLFGFVGECFATGMALWVLALWLQWRGRAFLQAPLALLASLVLLAHVFGFAVYALSVVAIAAGDLVRRRTAVSSALRDLGHLVLPLALLAAAPGGHWMAPQYGPPGAKADALEWAVGLFDPVLDAGLVAAALLGLLAIARHVTVAPIMRAPLLALAAAFLVLPHGLGDATFIDARVPPVFMLMLSASLRWRDVPNAWRAGFERAALGLFALRWLALVATWASWQATYGQIRASFELLPRGARLIELGVSTDVVSVTDRPPLGHVASYAVAQRGALIPTMFAGGPHDLLSYRTPFAARHKAPASADAGGYDYFLLIHPERIDRAALPPFAVIASGADFWLARRIR